MTQTPINTASLRVISILLTIVIGTVVPLAFYFEGSLNDWLRTQWTLGRKFDHEPVELFIAIVYGLISIPFIMLTLWTLIKPTNLVTTRNKVFWISSTITIIFAFLGVLIDVFFYYYTHPNNW